MAHYAIGDVQGCYDDLLRLLDAISFSPAHDTLWFTGDLVNRGPKSLATLRYVKSLGERAVTVLGNHDLHLLAVAHGASNPRPRDTFADVLAAEDCAELLRWLRERPLLHHDAALGYTLIHAGLPPEWDIDTARRCAAEVERVLRSEQAAHFFTHMYGNQPDRWDEDLHGWPRLRFITNALTRLRYCERDGRLALAYKGAPGGQPGSQLPWFALPQRRSKAMKIIFGHWSTLGRCDEDGVFGLDTGCVWGGRLTAMRLDDEKGFSVVCAGNSVPGED